MVGGMRGFFESNVGVAFRNASDLERRSSTSPYLFALATSVVAALPTIRLVFNRPDQTLP